uniref:NAD(+) kinase n=1 Tax=Romanomermis culicivorax TaxID=13658 RepID=A0A915JJX5_ROMCU
MEKSRNKTISGEDLAEKLNDLISNDGQNNEILRKNDSFYNGMTHHDSSPYFTDYDQNIRLNDLKNSRIKNEKSNETNDNNNNNNNGGDELHQIKKFEIKSTEIKFEDDEGRPKFRPHKVLILTKLTRLEFERRTNPDLKERGSDYNRLLAKYRVHSSYLKTICDELQKQGIEYRTVQRWDYSEENIEWADAIFTAGGDGTFLLAASKIRSRNKPVIGINTDPSGSEGYMCLLKKLPENKFPEALSRLLGGEFQWLWRQRIRVTLSGKHAFDDPIELHDQQGENFPLIGQILIYPEYRWSEHVREYEDVRNRLKTHFKGCTPLYGRAFKRRARSVSPSQSTKRVLPFLALNEVFIGESLSSRVSYYELQVDDKEKVKQKSSGFTVCTGTGSTSWYFNINKLTDRCVADLLQIINEELGVQLPTKDPAIINKLCRRFNDQLIFSPSDLPANCKYSQTERAVQEQPICRIVCRFIPMTRTSRFTESPDSSKVPILRLIIEIDFLMICELHSPKL